VKDLAPVHSHAVANGVVFESACRRTVWLMGCDRYEWERNGRPYVPTTTEGDTGTIIIDQPERSDEGGYQCFASNSVGTAMSNTSIVVKSERAVFSRRTTAQAYQARIGDKLRVDCQPISRGIPSPLFGDYSWEDDDSDTTWPLSRHPLSRHVQIDDSGMYTRCVEN